MAKRNIIEIDEELCNGCGQCILDCAEGALEIRDGKARLVGEILCDGLGACLSGCPTGALKVIQREAEEFDEQAAEQRVAELKAAAAQPEPDPSDPVPLACGCPGSAAQALDTQVPAPEASAGAKSTLGHWPVKLQLLSPESPFLKDADLLLLADCAAVANPDLHGKVLPGRAIAIACPKLDDAQAHVDKLATLLAGAKPKSLTVMIMEVPCCRGLVWVAQQALDKAGIDLPVSLAVITRDGQVRRGDGPVELTAA